MDDRTLIECLWISTFFTHKGGREMNLKPNPCLIISIYHAGSLEMLHSLLSFIRCLFPSISHSFFLVIRIIDFISHRLFAEMKTPSVVYSKRSIAVFNCIFRFLRFHRENEIDRIQKGN